MPVVVPDVVELQARAHVSGCHGPPQVLLVRKDENDRTLEVIAAENAPQLVLRERRGEGTREEGVSGSSDMAERTLGLTLTESIRALSVLSTTMTRASVDL